MCLRSPAPSPVRILPASLGRLLVAPALSCLSLRPVWPGSHQRIWEAQWKAYEERGELHTHSRRGVTERSEWFGMFDSIHEDTTPFDTHAPSGSVVLWVRASSCP